MLVKGGGVVICKSREVWLKEEVHDKVCDTRRGIRLAIGMYYLQVLGSPPKKEWDGRHGTVAHIYEIWDILLKLKKMVGCVAVAVALSSDL